MWGGFGMFCGKLRNGARAPTTVLSCQPVKREKVIWRSTLNVLLFLPSAVSHNWKHVSFKSERRCLLILLLTFTTGSHSAPNALPFTATGFSENENVTGMRASSCGDVLSPVFAF